jgi:hypothetical protein
VPFSERRLAFSFNYPKLVLPPIPAADRFWFRPFRPEASAVGNVNF